MARSKGYVGSCQLCGRQIEVGDRRRLQMMREVGCTFSTDSYARYYCPACAERVKVAVEEFEEACHG